MNVQGAGTSTMDIGGGAMTLAMFVISSALVGGLNMAVEVPFHGMVASLVASGMWMLFLKVRPSYVFSGTLDGDIAHIGAMLVFLSSVAQRDFPSLLPSAAFSVLCWFAFMDRNLNVPDDSWLKETLESDTNVQTIQVSESNPLHRESTAPLRLKGYDKKLLECHEDCGDCTTVQAILERSKLLFFNNQMCGTRKVNEDGSLGEYKFSTYGQVFELIDRCAYHLSISSPKLIRVGVLAKNCEDYIVLMFAALKAGIVVVPLYDTLGKDAVSHIINHAELTTVCCSEENLPKLLKLKSQGSNNVLNQIFVFKDRTTAGGGTPIQPREEHDAKIAPFENLLAAFEQSKHNGYRKVEKNDLAFILYTSGTTGEPKGVMLTQSSIVASGAALCTSVNVKESDVHLSYLPLAHAFELAVIICGVMRGASVGFFHGNVKELTEDAKILRPTIFAGVPRVFQRVRQVILQQMALKPAPIRRLCYHAIRAQIQSVRHRGKRILFYDLVVFRSVRAALGGRVRVMCTGSAPLSPSIQEFIKVCFKCPIVEGYGMTETSGVCNAMLCENKAGYIDQTIGSVGPPLACCEYKLLSVPELKYTIHDKPLPRGEILVRGNNIFAGYFKKPNLTKEVLVDGWLHTGDIGQINENGSLSLVDRKKSLFKLAQGEYISPELLESKMLGVPAVGQVFIHGSSHLPHLVAIVVPDPLELIPRLKQGVVEGINPSDVPTLSPDLSSWLEPFNDLCQSTRFGPSIKAYLLAEMKNAAREAELPKFMWPRDILVVSKLNQLLQGFSVDNDMLTPTFKYKRKNIYDCYAVELQYLLENVPENPTPKIKYPVVFVNPRK